MPAGFAKVEITPPLDRCEVYGLGYWFHRSVRFTGVRDPLFVRAAALGDGPACQFLISVDAIFDSAGFIPEATAGIARQAGVPEANVFISCTHTHSTPLTGLNNAGRDGGYGQYVAERIVACAMEAFRKREPAQLGISRGKIPEVLYNRRPLLKNGSIAELHVPLDPATVADPGAVNDTATILKFLRSGGAAIGAIVHFGIHGVAIQCSDLISSDCMGRAVQRLEAEAGGGTVVMHLNAPCGDIDPLLMGGEAALDEMTGRLFAGLRSVNAAEPMSAAITPQASSRGSFRARRRTTRAPEALREEKQRLAGPDDNLSHHSGAGYQRFLIDEELALAALPEEFEIPYQVLRMGGIVWIGVGGEIFTSAGLRLAGLNPRFTILPVGITRAWNGYLPPREAFAQGGYEVTPARWCPVAPGETEKLFAQIEAETLRLLEREPLCV